MLDNKFFFSLIGIMVAVFAMCNVNFSNMSKENYWGGNPGRALYIVKESKDLKTGKTYALQPNLQGHLGADKFVSTANLQPILSPRLANYSTGAHINYNPTDLKNLAVDRTNPLTLGYMAQNIYEKTIENFDDSTVPSCGKGGFSTKGAGNIPAPANYSTGNYKEEMAKVWEGGVQAVDSLPVGDMSTINALGDTIQPIVYDRYIFANRHSRLRAQGDPIRGDLAIVPCNTGWFNVSVNMTH